MKTFSHFLASEKEMRLVDEKFQRFNSELDFWDPEAKYLKSLPEESGIYFVAGVRERLLKGYVGRTSSIMRRMSDYHRDFQVRSSDDKKLAFFQEWLAQIDPGWKLVLFTKLVPKEALVEEEKHWIQTLNPFVNGREPIEVKRKKAVENAHREYYANFFDRRQVTKVDLGNEIT